MICFGMWFVALGDLAIVQVNGRFFFFLVAPTPPHPTDVRTPGVVGVVVPDLGPRVREQDHLLQGAFAVDWVDRGVVAVVVYESAL